MELVQNTTTLPWGGGQWKFAAHNRNVEGQWAVELPRKTATPPWVGGKLVVELLPHTVTLPWGSRQWNTCRTQPPRPGAAGSSTPAARCHTTLVQWAAEFLQHTAALPRGCGKLPGGGGQFAVELLPHTVALPWGYSGRRAITSAPPGGTVRELLLHTATVPCGSGTRHTLPHYLGTLRNRSRAEHCHSGWGHRAVENLVHTAPLPCGSRPWKFCNTLPQCVGAVGSVPRAAYRHTA